MKAIDLFISGENGYNTYRIPSIVTTKSGIILALCEARKNSYSDYGRIDIVMRRSFDNGVTWEPVEVIANDGENTMGNQCPVVDRNTGRVWLVLCGNLENGGESMIKKGLAPRYVYVMYSDDEGGSWSVPADITGDVKCPDWTWYATGPCHGIQLKSGRILILCNHAVLNPETGTSKPYQSHVIYSDDYGKTWHIGGILDENTNESCAVELQDGWVYINMRNYLPGNKRAYSTSCDGGINWESVKLDDSLTDPMCQGSIIRHFDAKSQKNFILFSNCDSIERKK